MAGQIIARGERVWLVRVFLGRDPSTGKRNYHNKTIHGNKKDAQKYLNGVLREKDLGTFVEPSALTINEYLDQWLEKAAKPRLRERSFIEYGYILQLYIRPAIGTKKLSDIQPLDLQSIYASMQERRLSPRTIRYANAVISSAFKQALKWRMLVHNPATLVELPRESSKEMQALSPEEASRFLEAIAEDRFGLLLTFALITGMRPEEYLGIQWKDVDLQKGIVSIQRTVVWLPKGKSWSFGEPKTTRSKRSIPLPDSLTQNLVRHKHKQLEERLKKGKEYQNYDLVFATSEGTPIMRRNLVRRHFKPALKRAGLPETLRLYDLRHSCATLLLAENENPKVVSERLGHSRINITLDTYSHVLPSMQQAASDKLEKLLSLGVAHYRHTK